MIPKCKVPRRTSDAADSVHNIFPFFSWFILLYEKNMSGTSCKRCLCVSSKATNIALLGDCASYPMWIESARRCIKYRLNLVKIPDFRYVKSCYEILLQWSDRGYFNWAREIEQRLWENGLGYVWFNLDSDNLSLHSFTQRLKDKYSQNW